jgi:hypothetical protein
LRPGGLTKEHATFTGRELRIAALRCAAGFLDVGQVEQLILDLQHSGDLRLTGEDRWTTRTVWEQEQRVLAWYEERTGDAVADREPRAPTQQQLLRALATAPLGERVRLSMEQSRCSARCSATGPRRCADGRPAGRAPWPGPRATSGARRVGG